MTEEERNYYLGLFRDILDGLEKHYKPETVAGVMREQGMLGILQLRLGLFAACHKIERLADLTNREPTLPELN